jgi:hypothetical protein
MDSENRYFKNWIVIGIIFLCILAGYFSLPKYRHFKEHRSAAEAQAFFDKGDYPNALLCVRRTLIVNSNNVTACRIMAKLADVAHSPAALDWCQRLVKLSPDFDNQLLLASFGLRYQEPPYPLTTQTLNELSSQAADMPAYHILLAELDLSLHQANAAEKELQRACKLDPTNQIDQLNLAVIELGSPNKTTASNARVQLEKFRTDPNLGPAALRPLLTDRLLHNDTPAALTYSTQLLASAQANLNDRLMQLTILKQLQDPKLASQLNLLQLETVTNALAVDALSGWMQANGYLQEAINWLTHLSPSVQSQPPVRLALVDCYIDSENWRALRDLTVNDDWGDADYLRLAFLSHSWSKLNESVMADADWNSAVIRADDQLGALNALLQLANHWDMEPERENLLWQILRKFPDAGWAQHDLEAIYFTSGNTRALYDLYSERLPVSPQNAELKNNLAFTALLLKTNLLQAFQWAADAYTRTTNDAPVISTYAYALHLQGRDQDGLVALQKLDETVLEQPSMALYYGVLLSATGKTNAAVPYLQIAKTKGTFLPEEKQLLGETMQ